MEPGVTIQRCEPKPDSESVKEGKRELVRLVKAGIRENDIVHAPDNVYDDFDKQQLQVKNYWVKLKRKRLDLEEGKVKCGYITAKTRRRGELVHTCLEPDGKRLTVCTIHPSGKETKVITVLSTAREAV